MLLVREILDQREGIPGNLGIIGIHVLEALLEMGMRAKVLASIWKSRFVSHRRRWVPGILGITFERAEVLAIEWKCETFLHHRRAIPRTATTSLPL